MMELEIMGGNENDILVSGLKNRCALHWDGGCWI